MNTDELIRAVAKKCDFTFGDTSNFINGLTEVFEDCVKNREQLVIVNVGVLDFSTVKARKVNNKLLGDRDFPEVERVFFRLSHTLKNILKDAKQIK